MSKTIGIDLGTTNSCVAFIENGDAVVIPNSEGGRTTPSVVAFTKSGERIVGQLARRQAAVNPARTLLSVKRDMGSDKKYSIDGRNYTPAEISAMILTKLKQDAEAYLGEPVSEAVITVPAYFTDSQRQATRDAGQIAGLSVKRIINEPTSAALAFGIDKDEPQKIMVYDLGGGTFDVSILDIQQDVIEVLATSGNNRLGGDDFDRRIVDFLAKEFKKETKIDVTRDAAAMERLRDAAEKAKIELSATLSASVSLPFFAQDKQGPRHLDTTLTRAKFNELTGDLVTATIGPMKQALSDANLTASQIGKVLLVGGSSRIPAVQDAVKSFIGKEPFRGVNPDECVAMGAAIQGGILGSEVKSLLLLDVTPMSLGVETVGNCFSKIIERNSTLPAQRSEIYTTAASFQTSVEINVLQGEDAMASRNRSLGKFRLDGIRRAMRGVPQIEVTFSIDANGIVNVSAKDLGTGHQQHITILNSSNMSQSDIDRAIQENKAFLLEDKAGRALEEAVNRAEDLLRQSGSALSSLPDGAKQVISPLADSLRRELKTKNAAAIRRASDELARALGIA